MRAILPRTPGRTPASSTAPALFPTGEIVGRYQVEAVIGLGGTGTVFRCFDKERGSLVAVKAIPHDATLRRRAQREVEVARRLDHPNVVRLLDSARDDDYIYVISELVDGGDLGASLRAGALGDAALLRACSATCAGLAHAHAAGIVHRDVKPANILLGGDGTVQLADFGIAMLVGPDATVDDRLLGTLSYMAPEICTGSTPTPSADIWSVGVMLYEAMTGANPFRARSPAELADRHGERPRPLAEVRPDLGRPLAAACARALSRDPRRRPSAASLATVFEAAADRLEAPASARVVELRPRQRSRGHRIPTPRVPRPSLRLPKPSLPSGRHLLGSTASTLNACGLPEPLAARAAAHRPPGRPGHRRRGRRRGDAARVPVLAASLTTPIALVCGGLAIVAPWSASALVLAVCIPGLGNLSSALAWACALLGVVWLGLSAGSGRRALLPILAPVALLLLAFPAFLIAAGRLRSAPGRFLAGASGPLAIALWAAHTSAGAYAGTGDASAVARQLVHAPGPPLVAQSLAWGAVAMAWPLAWSGWRIGRAAALAVWFALALAAQAVIPAALGVAPEPVHAQPRRRRGRCYPHGPERAGPRRRCMSRTGPARTPGMGFLRSIESGIEHVVDGTVGRVVRVSVQPVEIARKLAKELEDGKVESGGRTVVPSQYTVYLPSKDRERFSEYEASLRVELGAYLAEHVRREGYAVRARPRVTFETADELASGTFGIATEPETPVEPVRRSIRVEPAPVSPGSRPRRAAARLLRARARPSPSPSPCRRRCPTCSSRPGSIPTPSPAPPISSLRPRQPAAEPVADIDPDFEAESAPVAEAAAPPAEPERARAARRGSAADPPTAPGFPGPGPATGPAPFLPVPLPPVAPPPAPAAVRGGPEPARGGAPPPPVAAPRARARADPRADPDRRDPHGERRRGGTCRPRARRGRARGRRPPLPAVRPRHRDRPQLGLRRARSTTRAPRAVTRSCAGRAARPSSSTSTRPTARSSTVAGCEKPRSAPGIASRSARRRSCSSAQPNGTR